MRNLSKIIVLRDKNRPLYLPLKFEKNGNSLNKFFFILKFMEKYLLNKLIFMFSKNELFISYEQCLPSVWRTEGGDRGDKCPPPQQKNH